MHEAGRAMDIGLWSIGVPLNDLREPTAGRSESWR